MKLRLKFYLQIIMMFAIPFIVSLVIQYANIDLGDWTCDGINCDFGGSFHSDKHGDASNHYNYINVPETHWGFRHWMLNLAGIGIWIVNVVFLIIDIDRASKK